MAAKIFTGFIVSLLVLEAIAASVIVPEYNDIFTEFGADLPTLTQVILVSPFWVWLLPASALGFIALARSKGKGFVLPVLFVFFLGVLYVPAALYGVYIPIIELSQAGVQ